MLPRCSLHPPPPAPRRRAAAWWALCSASCSSPFPPRLLLPAAAPLLLRRRCLLCRRAQQARQEAPAPFPTAAASLPPAHRGLQLQHVGSLGGSVRGLPLGLGHLDAATTWAGEEHAGELSAPPCRESSAQDQCNTGAPTPSPRAAAPDQPRSALVSLELLLLVVVRRDLRQPLGLDLNHLRRAPAGAPSPTPQALSVTAAAEGEAPESGAPRIVVAQAQSGAGARRACRMYSFVVKTSSK